MSQDDKDWEKFNEEMDQEENSLDNKEIPFSLVKDEILKMMSMCTIFESTVTQRVLIKLIHNLEDKVAEYDNT